MTLYLRTEFDCPIPSRGNIEKHWRVRASLVDKQHAAVREALGITSPPSPPLTVVLTRIASGRMDTDNVGTSLKGPRDAVAQWLGVDDGDPEVVWLPRFEHTTGLPTKLKRNGKRAQTQRLRIEIYHGIERCECCGQVVVPGERVTLARAGGE